MKKSSIFISLFILSPLGIQAQKLNIKTSMEVPDPKNPELESLVAATGNSQTKNGIYIPFQVELNSKSMPTGYAYKKAELERINEYDVVLLFVPKVNVSSMMIGNRKVIKDDNENNLINEPLLDGVWKEMTVLKKLKTNNEFRIFFAESCGLNDNSFINAISLAASGDNYIFGKTWLDFDVLILALKNKDEFRIKSARLLGRLKDKRALGPLIYALPYREGHDWVADALNKIDPNWMSSETFKKAAPVFINALKEEQCFKYALESLYKIDAQWMCSQAAKDAVPSFVTLLKEGKSNVRCNMAKTLGLIKDPSALEPLIAEMKHKDCYDEVKKAIETTDPNWMDSQAARNALPMFIEMLNDADRNVRLEAAKALEGIKDKRAIPALSDVLQREDGFIYVKNIAAMALGEFHCRETIDPLIQSFKSSNSKDFCDLVTKILINLDDSLTIEPLIAALKDENIIIRIRAAWILGDKKEIRSVEPLIMALKDKYLYDLTPSLTKIKPNWIQMESAKEIIPKFLTSLTSESPNIRENTIQVLRTNKYTPAVESVIHALNDEFESVRREAANALGIFGDSRAVEPLIQALEDKKASVRLEAIWALGLLKDKRAVKPLTKFLKTDDPFTRSRAAEALEKITGKSNLEE